MAGGNAGLNYNTSMKTKKTDTEFLRGYKVGVKQAAFQGYKMAIAIVFMVLKDKHDAPTDDLMQLWKEIDSYTQEIHNGNMKYKDMETVLNDEYGIEFKWV